MSPVADPMLDSIVNAVLAKLPAANDTAPAWRALSAEARLRGKSPRAFRRWCVTHGVTIRQENHRDAWVSPAEVDRAVEGFNAVETRAQVADEVDQAINARYNGPRR